MTYFICPQVNSEYAFEYETLFQAAEAAKLLAEKDNLPVTILERLETIRPAPPEVDDWERRYQSPQGEPWTPNVVRYSPSRKVVNIECVPGSRGDFALNEAALDYMVNAVKRNTLVGANIILKNALGNIVAAHDARTVKDNLRQTLAVRTNPAYGPYYWITREGKPVEFGF